jgi:magnesium transporter
MAVEPDETRPWEALETLVLGGSHSEVHEFLDRLPVDDVVLAVTRLTDSARARLAEVLTTQRAAELVETIPDAQAVDVLERLAPDRSAAILERLPSDEQADLLGDLSRQDADAILSEMSPDEADQARILSRYPDDVAGGLMIREYLTYPEFYTVGRVLQDLRSHADEYRDYVVQYAYVTRRGRLRGVLRLRDLLFGHPAREIHEIMLREPLSVPDSSDLDELRAFFERNTFYGAPVVDPKGRLVGIVTRAAVEAARADRSDSDYLKTQGIVGGEELRTMPLAVRSRRRLAWLSMNIGLNIAAASIIAVYQETIAAVIALAVFLPIISDMSGCSGNQAVAVSMRELTLGVVRPTEVLRVWGKEVSVGAVNGIALGALIAGAAWAWDGNPALGAVVGIALAVNTVFAVSVGGVVPLVLRRFNMDPALASGPILTTLTDMCGFFLLLSLATAAMPLLTT